MDCCICGEQIEPNQYGWDRGHNARPVKEGQCCLKCNNDVVVPARIALFTDPSKPKTFVRLSDLVEQDTSPNGKGEANGCTDTTTDGST